MKNPLTTSPTLISTLTGKILTCGLLTLISFATQAQVAFEEELKAMEYDVGFLLTWSTNQEINNQLFVIERSTDGTEFTTIGSIESEADESVNDYEFKDLDLGLKEVTYRLKQVSVDGSFSFSDPISMTKASINKFRVAKKEKISDELFQVTINSIIDGELECRITTNMGDVVLKEPKEVKPGLNDFIFDLAGEMDGGYNIIFKLDRELESVYFEKEVKDKKGNVANKKKVLGDG